MKAKIEGYEQEIEIYGPEDWTTRELSTAEHKLGLVFDGTSAGAGMAITLFIALKRAQPDKPDVLLADEVLDMKFSMLQEATSPLGEDEEEETSPLVPDDLPTSGTLDSEPTESLSTSKT